MSGLMDDVCAIATPRALAAAMPMMARRLQRDGARLEQSKSVWTTLSPATRAQIPTGMRVGQAEDAHGQTHSLEHMQARKVQVHWMLCCKSPIP